MHRALIWTLTALLLTTTLACEKHIKEVNTRPLPLPVLTPDPL